MEGRRHSVGARVHLRPGDLRGQTTAILGNRMAVVSGHSCAGDRPGTGWRAGHGGPIHLYPAHRFVHHGRVGRSRAFMAQCGRAHPGGHCEHHHRRTGGLHLDTGRLLAERLHAFRPCGSGYRGQLRRTRSARSRLH